MELTIFDKNDYIIVKINDKKFTYNETASFKNQIYALTDSGNRKIFVDMSDVEFMDSNGLGVLISLKASCNKASSGKSIFAIICGEGRVKELFKITKADSFIDIFSDIESAGESL